MLKVFVISASTFTLKNRGQQFNLGNHHCMTILMHTYMCYNLLVLDTWMDGSLCEQLKLYKYIYCTLRFTIRNTFLLLISCCIGLHYFWRFWGDSALAIKALTPWMIYPQSPTINTSCNIERALEYTGIVTFRDCTPIVEWCVVHQEQRTNTIKTHV